LAMQGKICLPVYLIFSFHLLNSIFGHPSPCWNLEAQSMAPYTNVHCSQSMPFTPLSAQAAAGSFHPSSLLGWF
jgi:hypothetical protein